MKKIKITAALVICIALSSCGIFKKDCNCPHFGKTIEKKVNRVPVS
jgi:hypothetical protein